MPGQVLIEADRDKEGGLSFIRGHGTYQQEGKRPREEGEEEEEEEEEGGRRGGGGGTVRLCACNAGVVERVNKLVTVLPPKARYQVGGWVGRWVGG